MRKITFFLNGLVNLKVTKIEVQTLTATAGGLTVLAQSRGQDCESCHQEAILARPWHFSDNAISMETIQDGRDIYQDVSHIISGETQEERMLNRA